MMAFVSMKPYTLQVPADVALQLKKCHASLRQSIRKRLREIADGLTARPAARGKVAPLLVPPLRVLRPGELSRVLPGEPWQPERRHARAAT
jgi:hypothetical protein